MGTRSIIAKQTGDSWRGRYAHWDGYPTNMASQLWNIVARDGVETAIKVLIDDHFYWSSVNMFANADDPMSIGMNDGRFANVAGYGITGTTEQASPDEWYGPEDMEASWAEWVYIISEGGLMILDAYSQSLFGFFPWGTDEPEWSTLQSAWFARDAEEVEA